MMPRRGQASRRANGPPSAGVPGVDWNTEGYLRDARFVPELGRGVLAWLAPRRWERILDLGCGDGALTAEIAASGATVVGIDSSPRQTDVARGRGLDARVIDATALPFRGEFDAVFTNAALHWIRDQDSVLGGAYRALRSGGRFVGEMGGRGNVARIVTALEEVLGERGHLAGGVSPWVFPDPDEFSAALGRAGFRVSRMARFERPTDLDCSMTDWLEIFAPAFARVLPARERVGYFAEVATRLEPALFDPARGRWWVDYVRLRFEAVRP